MSGRPPVDESLEVLSFEDVYSNDEWRRSVVRYQYDSDSKHDEVAVYLWHLNEKSWTRKNKYVIKTHEAWQTDTKLIDQLWEQDSPALTGDAVPVSDYYSIVAGDTVFKTDDWWKAIVKLDQKGSYETEEVLIYLWQNVDGDWRRRQKCTFKSASRWNEERKIIGSVLGTGETAPAQRERSRPSEPTGSTSEGTPETAGAGVDGELEALSRELEDHLSGTLQSD